MRNSVIKPIGVSHMAFHVIFSQEILSWSKYLHQNVLCLWPQMIVPQDYSKVFSPAAISGLLFFLFSNYHN